MTTVLNPPQIGAEERFLLRNVTWETHEQLLKNYQSFSAPRFTYHQGDLEIMRPSIPHEAASRILSLLRGASDPVSNLAEQGIEPI
jgi:Uma2 family endonuclease